MKMVPVAVSGSNVVPRALTLLMFSGYYLTGAEATRTKYRSKRLPLDEPALPEFGRALEVKKGPSFEPTPAPHSANGPDSDDSPSGPESDFLEYCNSWFLDGLTVGGSNFISQDDFVDFLVDTCGSFNDKELITFDCLAPSFSSVPINVQLVFVQQLCSSRPDQISCLELLINSGNDFGYSNGPAITGIVDELCCHLTPYYKDAGSGDCFLAPQPAPSPTTVVTGSPIFDGRGPTIAPTATVPTFNGGTPSAPSASTPVDAPSENGNGSPSASSPSPMAPTVIVPTAPVTPSPAVSPVSTIAPVNGGSSPSMAPAMGSTLSPMVSMPSDGSTPSTTTIPSVSPPTTPSPADTGSTPSVSPAASPSTGSTPSETFVPTLTISPIAPNSSPGSLPTLAPVVNGGSSNPATPTAPVVAPSGPDSPSGTPVQQNINDPTASLPDENGSVSAATITGLVLGLGGLCLVVAYATSRRCRNADQEAVYA